MTTQQQYIEHLKGLVIKKFGREITSTEDCVALADAIGVDAENELVIKAIGIIFMNEHDRGYAPRPALLSSLARYVGYSGWSDFCTSPDILPSIETNVIPVTRRWGVIIVTLFAVIIVVVTVVYLLSGSGDGMKTPCPTISQATEHIAEEWRARTLEECNTVRYYAARRNYAEQVESFREDYESDLTAQILKELNTYLVEQGMHYSDEEIMAEAEAISEQCRAICNCL